MSKKPITLVCDSYFPQRNSAAFQMHDLATCLQQTGHQVELLVADRHAKLPVSITKTDGMEIIRVGTPKLFSDSQIGRGIRELISPIMLLWHLKKNGTLRRERAGIIWYSPSIFLGLLVAVLLWKSKCKGYLILRDIFPDWMADLKLMRRGTIYFFLRLVAKFQYRIADTIGVQSKGDLKYFKNKNGSPTAQKIEVLDNWLSPVIPLRTSWNVDLSSLKGRKIFIYAGNFGKAQNLPFILSVARQLEVRRDIGFILIGRGDEFDSTKQICESYSLKNVLCLSEVGETELSWLFSKCHFGIVSLNFCHKSNNIPGKFIAYMRAGLPVLASVNAGNEIIQMINKNGVGYASASENNEFVADLVEKLADGDVAAMSQNAQALFAKRFAVDLATRKLLQGIS